MGDVNISGLKSNNELKLMALEKLKGKWIRSFLVCITFLLIEIVISKIVSALANDTLFTSLSSYEGKIRVALEGVIFIIFSVAVIVCSGAIELGQANYFLKLLRSENPSYVYTFSGFKLLGRSFTLWIAQTLFTCLWGLLFMAIPIVLMFVNLATRHYGGVPYLAILGCLLLIPAVIATIIISLRYSQVFYILSDNNNIGALNAIKKSVEMMKGVKAKFFGLLIRFFGWFLLIGILSGLLSYVSGLLFHKDSHFNFSAGTIILYVLVLIIIVALMLLCYLRLYPLMNTSFACFYEDLKLNGSNTKQQESHTV